MYICKIFNFVTRFIIRAESVIKSSPQLKWCRFLSSKKHILPDSFPRTRCSRWGKAVSTDWRCGVGYSEVYVNRLEEFGILEGPRDALHLAVARLDDPWVELTLDGEREGGWRDQANEDQEEFHLATLPRLACVTATDRARHDLWITSASRNDRLSFTPARLITTPSSLPHPNRFLWKYYTYNRSFKDHWL